MAITTATSQQTTNSTTAVCSMPASVAAGDMLIAIVGEDSGATSNTWNNSFNELLDSSAATGVICAAAYKIAAGGETSVTATHTTERSNHIAIRIPAAEWANDGTAPEITTVATGSSTTPDPPSISPSWGTNNQTIFIAVMYADDSAAPGPITAFPTNYANNQVSNTTATSACVVASAIRTATAASEDPGSFTMTGTETWGAVVIAVKGLSTGTTVTPDTASLTLATFAPTVSTTDNKLVTPGVLALTTATFAPTVTASDHKTVTPDTASLTLTTFAPSVNVGINAVPSTLALSLATFAPTVSISDNQTVTPGVAALTLTSFAPQLQLAVTPSTTALTLSAFAPAVTVTDHKVVTPDTATLTLTTFAPGVTGGAGQTVTPPTAALVLSAFAPTVTATDHKLVTPATASLALTALAPDVLTPVVVTPSTLALVLATYVPVINEPVVIGGTPPSPHAAIHTVPPASASMFTLSGNASTTMPGGSADSPTPGR